MLKSLQQVRLAVEEGQSRHCVGQDAIGLLDDVDGKRQIIFIPGQRLYFRHKFIIRIDYRIPRS